MKNLEMAPEGGSCVGFPTDWWFPIHKNTKRDELMRVRKETNEAKAICRSCPVREECLEYSLRWEPWGIWGGYDERERAEMRWKNNISLHREGRIIFSGVGLRDANGLSVFGQEENI